MLNLINVLNGVQADTLCEELEPVLRIVGIAIFIIKVVVPIMLIIVGMLDMAKAVTEKDENKIKDAQHKLIKKAIAAGVQEVRSRLNNIWKDEDANAFLHLAGFVKCSA